MINKKDISDKLIKFDEILGDYTIGNDENKKDVFLEYESYLRKNMEEITYVLIHDKSFFDTHKEIIYRGYINVAPWTIICMDVAKQALEIKEYFSEDILKQNNYLLFANFYNKYAQDNVINIMNSFEDGDYVRLFEDLAYAADTSYEFLNKTSSTELKRFYSLQIKNGFTASQVTDLLLDSLKFSAFCYVNKSAKTDPNFIFDAKKLKKEILQTRNNIKRKIERVNDKFTNENFD